MKGKKKGKRDGFDEDCMFKPYSEWVKETDLRLARVCKKIQRRKARKEKGKEREGWLYTKEDRS